MLVAAAIIVLSMLAASAPVLAQGEGRCDPPTEASRGPFIIPPEAKPGTITRSDTGNEQDPTNDSTGFGRRCG